MKNRVNHCEHIGSETFSYKTEYVYRFKENRVTPFSTWAGKFPLGFFHDRVII